MKKISLFLFLLLLLGLQANAQKNFWTYTTPEKVVIPENESQWIVPKKFATLELDFNSFKKSVWNAPMEFTSSRGKLISIPMPDGSIKEFEVFQSPCMQEGLSAKFPNIRSFAGYNPENKLDRIRLDISHRGVKCIITSNGKQVYIDPFARKQTKYYIAYYTSDYEKDPNGVKFVCGLDDEVAKQGLTNDYSPATEEQLKMLALKQRTSTLPLNKYRIAIATTGLYSQFIGTTVEDVIAELNTAVNRINEVLTNDLSVKFELVNDNDKIIFFDENTDAYDDQALPQMINANQTVLAQNIGAQNFDIGHVFGRIFGGGVVGLAQIGAVCRPFKARGGSCLDYPKNDPYWIDIVAHEMGHQMNANHSFNNCGQNENASTAYEPGSGTTIMSYSGACGSNNVTIGSDAMYNVGALEEILPYMHISSGDGCANKVELDNHHPTVQINLKNNFYIPISTPFELNCKAEDEDGDTLTYSWEQYDLGDQSPLGMPIQNAPSFRVFAPNSSTSRTFPRIDRILSNTQNVSEVLPTYSRDLTFQVVVRDNHFGGGATAQAKVNFKATDKAGPFIVSYPNTFDTWTMGTDNIVTWNVAKTDSFPVNCKRVNILLSIDGGYTYPYVLACNTANDGTEPVIVPAIPKAITSARIRVEAADNIFFDVSNQNFAINEPATESVYFNVSNCFEKFCAPDSITADLFVTRFNNYNGEISFEVNGLPSGSNAVFTKNPVLPGEDSKLNLYFDETVLSGKYNISITANAPGLDTFTRIIPLEIIASSFGVQSLQVPASGSSGISKATNFTWQDVSGAESYEIQIATSPSFGASIIETKSGLKTTQYTPNNPLNESTLYFWRVRPTNECRTGDWSDVSAFHTITLSCDNFKNLDGKKGISGSGTPTVTSKITILGNGAISDVSISKIKGFHEYFNDLDVTLQSPAGTKNKLFTDQCKDFAVSFDFGLDDNASKNFTCPPTLGNVFKPLEPFSIFKGEESAGEWTLIVKDLHPSGGGELAEWNLKVCTGVSLNPPYIITNDTLKLKPHTGKKIDLLHLETGDTNNTPEQLSYTLVKLPEHGLLGNGNQQLFVGNKFTQQDINDAKFSYFNTEDNDIDDNFYFTVEDGEGGWIGIIKFNIRTDENILISTKDVAANQVLIYPNPAKDEWRISLTDNNTKVYKIDVYNLQGMKVRTYNQDETTNNRLSTQNLITGTYFVNIITSTGIFTQKLVIQK